MEVKDLGRKKKEKNGSFTMTTTMPIPDKYKLLIGKRIRHKCNDACCQMFGTVLDIAFLPEKTVGGETADFWAVVKWDVVVGEIADDEEGEDLLPEDYIQPVPVDKVELIVDDKRGYA